MYFYYICIFVILQALQGKAYSHYLVSFCHNHSRRAIIEEQKRENNYLNPLYYLDLSQRKNECANFEFREAVLPIFSEAIAFAIDSVN